MTVVIDEGREAPSTAWGRLRARARALEAIRTWPERKHQQVFKLFGYAGTGKTELASGRCHGRRRSGAVRERLVTPLDDSFTL